jgi:aminomethyltransferase
VGRVSAAGQGGAAETDALLRTPFHEQHVAAGARMVDFGGWEMPVQYPAGIIAEHLATRSGAGLFDVSHMGRFVLRGPGSAGFLQHTLSNNAEALDLLQAQYTIIPTSSGGAVDDAYLYRFTEHEYLLVVNASNRIKDREHLHEHLAGFPDVEISDETGEIAMLALQGKASRDILNGLMDGGALPEPLRNRLSIVTLRLPGDGGLVEARIARTGYTGEPVCFELFVPAGDGPALWDALVGAGAAPVGLGARDTLRLEAGLPLYGHELGLDPEGIETPIMSCPLAIFAVSFSSRKGDYVGRAALERQHRAYARIIQRDFSLLEDLPRLTRPLAVTGRGIAREGAAVLAGRDDKRFGSGAQLGWVTSGTAVPFWGQEGEGLCSLQTEEHHLRSIALAYLDSRVLEDDEVEIDIRGRSIPGLVVPHHLRSDAPPCARAIVWDYTPQLTELQGGETGEKALRLLDRAIANHTWRQEECIDLIPSEMTASPAARLLSITDPAGRYAEHKKTIAFYDADVFYYQGTGFIHEVERLLAVELRAYLGCPEVETRTVSGQMANTAVFSALVDYLNRADRRVEPRRIAKVMNNHIGKGGHLSAQPMGALRDYVARDPRTELPAVVDIPVLTDNPYKADVPALLDLIEQERPELVILGKSMVLHPEPVYEVRQFLDAVGIPAVVMYDMAHVLGLVGPRFQQPFAEGADIVTGSTHKTFFGTQRGIIGARWSETDEKWDLWEAIERRTFPGSVSNHHLGTLVGLLMAAFEMNHFKDAYQEAVLANAKAFAVALHDAGLDVAGDPEVDYTETHQVVVRVGYGRGPEVAGRLEDSGIIVNYQAAPDEEGFTAAGALRLGVAEMTRFGMGPAEFAEVAGLMAAVVLEDNGVANEVKKLRAPFTELGYCFRGPEFDPLVQRLHDLI